jgi:serine/threonine-protein kinase
MLASAVFAWPWPSASGALAGTLSVVSGGVCILSTLAFLTRRDRRRDVDTDFWSRVWSGPVGRVAFAIARRLGGRTNAPAAVTHRATELSLGMAVESLFESLPAATRAPLRALPAIASRLQADAQTLRHLHDNMHDGIAGLAGAEDSDAYRDLCAHRDRVRNRMTQAVGALESIRLNLLRLHAGSGSVEGLTTHIDMASELSAEIGRLVAARQEIEAGLSFPREIATTPA